MSLKPGGNTDYAADSVLVLELEIGGKGSGSEETPWRHSVSMAKPRGYRHVVLMFREKFVALAPIQDWKQEWGPMPTADAILPTPK